MRTHTQFGEDLALYALGELPAAEALEFRKHLESCAECRREFMQLQADLAMTALAVPPAAPSARSRQRLMDAIADEPRESRAVISRPRWWALAPAFGTAMLALFAILLWVDNRDLRHDLEAARGDGTRLQQDLGHARELIAMINAPDTMHVALVATAARPAPQARVVYQPRRGGLMLFANNLNPVPKGMTYELWMIPMDGKAPVPAGTFTPDAHGMATMMMPPMPENVAAKMFAVTIEKAGGSATPTMPIVMSGGTAGL